MKKILKKEVIIAFIIGIILASSITVYAYNYVAKDVSYTKPGTSTAISVETALNDLYNKQTNENIIKIGEYNSYETDEIDIKSKLPNDYKNLTINNFIVLNLKIIEQSGNLGVDYKSLFDSYDSDNGVLKLSKVVSGTGAYAYYINYTIGCILKNITVVE